MRLSKWQALGNDYLLAEPAELTEALTPELIRFLCDYHYGVGSNGILEIVGVDDDGVDLRIWNPDGSTAELSGNGARIAIAWAVRRSGTGFVRLRVGDRVVEGESGGDGDVELRVSDVEVGESEVVDVEGEPVELTPVSTGNPHAVIRRDPERGEILRLGPLVERHPRFPGRTNVQLVRVDGRNDLTVGVWERGAGETLSSGTSSIAAAAAAVANGWCESPITVHLPGGDLTVKLDGCGGASLRGPVEEICRIELVSGTGAE